MLNQEIKDIDHATYSAEVRLLRGGMSLPSRKLDKHIVDLPPPDQIILPLLQHIGQPATPICQVGQYIHKGEVVAQILGKVCARIHSPVSGYVKAIKPHSITHPSGMMSPCLFIHNDQQDALYPDIQLSPPFDPNSWDHLERDKKRLMLWEYAKKAGIVGLGGAGFPTHLKIGGRQNINTLVINGAECEPYISCDGALMTVAAEQLVTGIWIMQTLLNCHTTIVAIESNRPAAITAMKVAIASQNRDIKIKVLPPKYPIGAEKQLIEAVSGIRIPQGKIAIQVGVICQNVATAHALYQTVVNKHPVYERIVTVTGGAIQSPQNLSVRIGTPIQHLLDYCDWDLQQSDAIRIGGPMMGYPVQNLQTPISKTTNCILATTKNELKQSHEVRPCIRCGACAEVCPAGLLPQQLFWHAKSNQLEAMEKYQLNNCIECGCCDWVCPSNLPLVQFFRHSKYQIRQAASQKQKADYSKKRFEIRQQRIAEEKRKRAEKLAKKRAALKNNPDEIKAALAKIKTKPGA